MTLTEFQAMITQTLSKYQFKEDVSDPAVCGNIALEYNQTFYSGNKWRDQMYDIYTALNDGGSSLLLNTAIVATTLITSIMI